MERTGAKPRSSGVADAPTRRSAGSFSVRMATGAPSTSQAVSSSGPGPAEDDARRARAPGSRGRRSRAPRPGRRPWPRRSRGRGRAVRRRGPSIRSGRRGGGVKPGRSTRGTYGTRPGARQPARFRDDSRGRSAGVDIARPPRLVSPPCHSPVAQLAEQVTVNHRVRGSSPRWGATLDSSANRCLTASVPLGCSSFWPWATCQKHLPLHPVDERVQQDLEFLLGTRFERLVQQVRQARECARRRASRRCHEPTSAPMPQIGKQGLAHRRRLRRRHGARRNSVRMRIEL